MIKRIMNTVGCDQETALKLKDLAIQADKLNNLTADEAFDLIIKDAERDIELMRRLTKQI